jgi:hypothetical protein
MKNAIILGLRPHYTNTTKDGMCKIDIMRNSKGRMFVGVDNDT